MLHGKSESDTSTERIADNVDLFVAELSYDHRHIVTHINESDGPVA
jgi:hypothetical protein